MAKAAYHNEKEDVSFLNADTLFSNDNTPTIKP